MPRPPATVRGKINDAAIIADLVYGSLWYRLIVNVGPLDHQGADAVADTIAPA